MRKNTDNETCDVCNEPLTTPFERERGTHDECIEQAAADYVEK